MFRYIVALVVLISVLASGFYFARLEIIQFTFNKLAPSGIFLKRISGLQIGKNSLLIDSVELELGKYKSKQSIKGIKLDYLLRSGSIRGVYIQQASLSLPELADTGEPSPPILLSELLDFLTNQPVKSLEIGKLDLTDIGHSVALNFQTSTARSTLQIRDNDYETTLKLLHQDPDNPQVNWHLADQNRSIVILDFGLERMRDRFRLTGNNQIHLKPLVQFVLRHIEIPHKLIGSIDGLLNINIKTEMDNKLQNILSFPVELRLLTDSKISFVYPKQQDPVSDLEVNLTLPVPVDILVENAKQPQFNISASRVNVGIREKSIGALLKAKMSKVFCRWQQSIQCSMDTIGDLSIPSLLISGYEIKKLSGQISGNVGIDGNQVSVQLRPTELLKVQSLKTQFLKVTDLQIRSLTSGRLNYQWDSGRLNFKQNRIDAKFPYLETPEVSLASTVKLSQIDITYQKSLIVAMNVASDQIKLQRPGSTLPILGFRSKLGLAHDQLTISGHLLSDKKTKLLRVSAHHHLRRGSGRAKISSSLDFSENGQALSNYFSSWPYHWDLLNGHCTASGTVTWKTEKNADDLSGTFQQGCGQISGLYGDIAFFGVASDLSATYTNDNSLVSNRPAYATIEELEIGLPIRNIGLNFVFDAKHKALTVKRFDAELLGGRVYANDSVYRADREKNSLLLLVDSLQVKDVVSLANLDNVDADGVLNGKIPLSFAPTGLTIENGLLEAKKPGGAIRYFPDITAATTTETNPTLKIVTDALSNYHYETLRVETQYNENGDLHLKMRMQGMNPDMNDGQPINLNLNVTDNIPTLLKSLQSSRIITDVFERRFGEY